MKFIFLITFYSLASMAQLPKSINFDDLPICPQNTQGWCKMHVGSVSPTQPHIGYDHMYIRKEKLDKAYSGGRDRLLEIQRKKTTQFVLGPNQRVFINDRHHFSAATFYSDIPDSLKYVAGRIVKDWSELDDLEFWKAMEENNWAYLKDTKFKTIPFDSIPVTIDKLKDHPLRSFVPSLFDETGKKIAKAGAPFEEYYYAEFLHKKGFEVKESETIKKLVNKAEQILKSDKGQQFRKKMHALACQNSYF